MRFFEFFALWSLCFGTTYAQETSKYIHGVPVYNDAYSPDVMEVLEGIEREWIMFLKDGSDDMQVSGVCADSPKCEFEGKPSKGGFAMTTIRATEKELTEVVAKHEKNLLFIEPSMRIDIPPLETLDSEAAAIQSEDATPLLAAIESGQPRNQHYVIAIDRSGNTVGWGPFSSYNEADKKFSQVFQQYAHTIMAPGDQFRSLRCQGDCNRANVAAQLKKKWECLTGASTSCSAPTPAPTPAPSPGQSPSPTSPGSEGPPTDRWGLDRIDARTGTDGKYGTSLDGRGVHVYVVDTGIRTTHVDFSGRGIPSVDTSSGKVVVCDPGDTSCATDTHGHGGHCAGTVGGVKSGVAKQALLHAVKVMEDRGTGYTSRLAMGLDWVSQNHIKPAVISMSLGATGKSVTMKNCVNKAVAAGVTVVVAAGNDNGEACAQTPAHVPSAITVGATGTRDQRSTYSNYGSCLDIYAPGDNILSVDDRAGNSQFYRMSGTSMSTPHVAGAAALLLQNNPGLSPVQVQQSLEYYAGKNQVSDAKTGSPNLMLYVTDYTTTTTTGSPGNAGRRRSASRRRSPRRRGTPSGRRRSPRRRGTTRRRRRRGSGSTPARRRRRQR